MDDFFRRVSEAIRAAFPEERSRMLEAEVGTWRWDFEVAGASADRHPLGCPICGRRRGAVGGAPGRDGSTPFFGALGGWLEAGGIEFACWPCVTVASDRLAGVAVEPEMALTEVTRALRAAGFEEKEIAKLEQQFERAHLVELRDGECHYCGRTGRAAGPRAGRLLCAECANAAREALR